MGSSYLPPPEQNVVNVGDEISASTLSGLEFASPSGSQVNPFATIASVASAISGISYPVSSVAGRTGAITLSSSDISGLGTMATQTATNYLDKAGNLAGLSNTATARSNLGLGTMATQTATSYLDKAGNLAGLTNTTTARSNLGLGTMATQSSSNYSTTSQANALYYSISNPNGYVGSSALTSYLNVNTGGTVLGYLNIASEFMSVAIQADTYGGPNAVNSAAISVNDYYGSVTTIWGAGIQFPDGTFQTTAGGGGGGGGISVNSSNEGYVQLYGGGSVVTLGYDILTSSSAEVSVLFEGVGTRVTTTGITFPDGTSQSTAATGGGGSLFSDEAIAARTADAIASLVASPYYYFGVDGPQFLAKWAYNIYMGYSDYMPAYIWNIYYGWGVMSPSGVMYSASSWTPDGFTTNEMAGAQLEYGEWRIYVNTPANGPVTSAMIILNNV